MTRPRFALLALFALVACTGGAATSASTTSAAPARPSAGGRGAEGAVATARAPRQAPPEVPAPQDVHLPPIARSTLANGLEVNVVEYHTLPVLHLRLVARGAGSAADPAGRPGLAAFLGDMLKEGTRTKNSQEIAEAIEFVGGTLSVTTGADATTIAVSVLRDHAETALSLMAELAGQPTFPQDELDRLRRRELDRLTQMQNDPGWLSRRAFLQAVYGSHPYAGFDTTPEALRAIRRDELVAFHRARYRAGSMYLVAVGDVRPAEFNPLAARVLGRLPRGAAPAARFPELPAREGRQVIIVDRPNSAQSVIRIGNPALRRNNEDYIPLSVANQVLGGEASSRLFMDLRERRSLTYGAYSRVTASVDVGTFQASGSVRTPVTGQALVAFFEHLARIVHEPVPSDELAEARQFLVASFPLAVETPNEVAGLVSDLRLYGLPDTYWDTYRTRIGQVTPPQALAAAQRYIQPDRAVVVIVGSAAAFENEARRLGPVRVVNAAGETVRELPAQPAP